MTHQRLDVQAFGRHRQAQQAGLQRAVAHRIRHLEGVLPQQPDAHVRVRLAEHRRQVGKMVVVGVLEDAERHRAAFAGAQRGQCAVRAQFGVEQPLRPRHQGLARRGEHQSAPSAHEQRHAVLILHLAHQLGDRGLRQAHVLRGRGERPQGRGEVERPYLRNSHRLILWDTKDIHLLYDTKLALKVSRVLSKPPKATPRATRGTHT